MVDHAKWPGPALLSCGVFLMGVAVAVAAEPTGGTVASKSDTAAAEDNKAREVFNSLYGADLKRAAATIDLKDDLALAARLLEAAKVVQGQPGFLALLCDKACDLGLASPDGYDVSLAAMELLAKNVPATADSCRDRILTIRQRQYEAARGPARKKAGETLIAILLTVSDARLKAGDFNEASLLLRRALAAAQAVQSDRKTEIDDRTRELARVQRVTQQVERLRKRLETDPKDAAAREELVQFFLIECDNPVEAAKYLAETSDADLRKFIPAAAKGVEAAPELACTALGQWYRALADRARQDLKAPLYGRARAYYARFLNLHKAEDLDRTAAALALKTVDDALEKLGGAPATKTQWIDLLALVDPAKDAVHGAWRRAGTQLAVAQDRSTRITLPIVPRGNYQVQLSFARIEGNDSVSLILPVGPRSVRLLLGGWGGSVGGLALVDGRSADANGTAVNSVSLVDGRLYNLAATVQVQENQAAIEVALDGAPYLRWKGPVSALSLESGWSMPQGGALGLGANVGATFAGIRLHMLSGDAKPLR